MPRIYTEIRIAHETEEEKVQFNNELMRQAIKLGTGSKGGYIKLIVSLDSATGVISLIKNANIPQICKYYSEWSCEAYQSKELGCSVMCHKWAGGK